MRAAIPLSFVLLAACTSTPKHAAIAAPPAQAANADVVVTVYEPCARPLELAAGIEVFAVSKTGDVVPLGKTGVLGRIWLSKEKLRSLEPSLVLFCYARGGPCTSFFAGNGHLDLASFDEFSVDLPPVVFRQ